MKDGQRRERVLAQLAADGGLGTARLCEVGAQVVGMTGAGVMLLAGSAPRGAVCASSATSARIEELQYELGEGPCLDAHHLGRPVLEPDLAEPDVARWIAFSAPAVAAGVRALFGFPVQVGAVRLGAFHVYRDQPGALSDDQYADALVMADITAESILAMQANAPSGSLAVEAETGSDFHYAVHQASGMVAVQLGVGVGDAIVRLRAYAFGSDRRLSDVARDVVARRLRFHAEPGETTRTS